MCDFKPGDEVVCVDASQPQGPWWRDRPTPLREGRVYTVAEILSPEESERRRLTRYPDVRWRNDSLPGLELVEHRSPHGGGFRVTRFRKVIRRTDKRSLTEWLSQPSGDTDHLDKLLPAKKRERA